MIRKSGSELSEKIMFNQNPRATNDSIRNNYALSLLAAQQFIHADALCRKGLAQHRDAFIRIGRAAHENVERGIAGLRPSMDGDMALRQHRDAGDATRLEVVQVDMQKRRACCFDTATQRRFDMYDVVEPLGAVQIDDQMHAGATAGAADSEVGCG